ncbi:MAG: hypothetical protein CUN55_10025, partial [Phototrophicales bacterium]
DFIIDPLSIDDLAPLEAVFSAPHIEIVFHAAEADIGALRRDYGFEFNNIFDTYIAARTLGWPKVGLASILRSQFGIKLNKRYQQSDWSKRPLSAEKLAYAQYDTHYLLDLRDIMREQLIASGYWEEANEYFQQLTKTIIPLKEFDPEGFWRIRAAQYLSEQGLKHLRALYIWREKKAMQRDTPPFKIMQDQEMIAIAEASPRNYDEMMQVQNVSRTLLQRYAKALLRVILQSLSDPVPLPPANISRPDEQVLVRYQLLHQWRKHKAAERGVESDIILPRDALWALAYSAPASHDELARITDLWPHRRKIYANEILSVLGNIEG